MDMVPSTPARRERPRTARRATGATFSFDSGSTPAGSGSHAAATVPVALCEALEAGRVPAGGWLLMPAFGGGLTFNALLVKWGQRVTPLGVSDRELPPLTESALDMVNRIRLSQDPGGRSRHGLEMPALVDLPAGAPSA